MLDREVDLTKSARQSGQLQERKHACQLTSTAVRIACAAGTFDQEQSQIGEKLPIQLARVFAIVDRALDNAQGFGGVAVAERRKETFNAVVPAQAKGRSDVSGGYRR